MRENKLRYRTCPVCGEPYELKEEHGYKVLINNHRVPVCKWTCETKYEREHKTPLQLDHEKTIHDQLLGIL